MPEEGAFPPEGDARRARAACSAVHNPRLVAEQVFPALADWRPVLDRLDISPETRIGLAAASEGNRWGLPCEIVARGLVSEAAFHEAFAKSLRLGFESEVDPSRLIIEPDQCVTLLGKGRQDSVKRESRDGRTDYLIAPTRAGFTRLRHQIATSSILRDRLRLVPPSVLRGALYARASSLLSRNACFGLFERHPQLSAHLVLNAWQGGVVGVLASLLPLAALLRPADTLLGVHILATVFFIGCVALRGMASRSAGPRLAELVRERNDEELPIYSVLVALYREKEVVPQLVASLSRLDWPHGRLDVKLVCEADDAETIAALRASHLPPFMEVVAVPPGHPRTKPKALNYALPAAFGEFVVLFDAEDRPDPGQLREAWEGFRRGGPELACLQAPLLIANRNASFVSRMFGFEYCALFSGLLPFLSRHRLPLPLGGTSNHFRRAALNDAGGWDPFNVTEDADLAIRLARFGYRTEIITRPTLEDAPEHWRVWLPQRTRWFKGYMQSWLVHMRDPLALWRELGFRSFLTMQILYAGLVVSALVHPLLMLTLLMLGAMLLLDWKLTPLETVLIAADAVNILCGYAMFLLLGWRSAGKTGRQAFARVVLGTPLYWMMLSLAAWRALWQLCTRPHYWSKTPHKQSRPHGAEMPLTP